MALVVNQDNLKQVTQNPLTVIDFWAPWCGPCKMMKPTMQRLEEKYQERIRFGKLNVQHQQNLAKRYGVFSVPSLVVFEHGKAHERVTGFYQFNALSEFLAKKIAEVKNN